MRDLIRASIGEDCMLEPDAVHSFAVHGRTPAVVVAPREAQEAAAILKLASENGLAVECAGAGTRLRTGNPPGKLDVVMTSSRMQAIAEYEPADLVISIEAGTSFPQLQDTIAPHNQFLALDPPGHQASTVGAAIATGSAGPLRYAHGTPRDQVIGLEVVTGDGRVLRFGGRVVKNVAGYDVVRLMVGSRGTLGFLTRVNVRLKPQPELDQTVAITSGSFDAAAGIAEEIIANALEPVALEILSRSLAQDVMGSSQWTTLVRLHGNRDGVRDAVSRIDVMAPGTSSPDRSVWRSLAAAEESATLKVRLANLPALLHETAQRAFDLARGAQLENARFAMHAGDGIVRVLADSLPPASEEGVLEARTGIRNGGGSLIVERLPHGVSMDAFGEPEALRLMSEIKKVFDPAGILGVGRFVV